MERRVWGNNECRIENRPLRECLKRCFESTQCFLLPHPGLNVVTNSKYQGQIEELDPKFRKYVDELMKLLFNEESLIPKTILGEKLLGKNMLGMTAIFVSQFLVYKLN